MDLSAASPSEAPTVSVGELWEALPHWIDAADDADELEIALHLARVAATHEPQDTHQTAQHARLLLLQGRPVEARELLRAAGIAPESGARPTSFADVVATAAQAACGDQVAFRSLLQAASQRPGVGPATSQLIAVAAEQLGDWPTADRIWLQLWSDGLRTRLALVHIAVALVTARRSDPHRAVAVLQCAELLDRAVQQNDDAMLTDAVAALHRRGDQAGVRLLVKAVRVWNRRNSVVERLAHDLEPAAMRGYHRKARLLSLLIVPALAATGLGLLMYGVGAYLWREYVRVPGFDLADSIAWRGLGALRRNPGAYQPPTVRQVNSYSALGAVLGFCVGTLLAALGSALLDLVADINTLGVGAMTFYLIAMVLTLLVPSIAGVFAAQQVAVWRATRMARVTEEADLNYRARACNCWEAIVLTGPFAAAYLGAHLSVRPLAPDAAARLAGLPGATTATCPTAGTSWLAITPTEASERTVLLRGPAPEPPDTGTAVGGFYL